MLQQRPQTIYLQDYQRPDFAVDSVFLHFDLNETETIVQAVQHIKRNSSDATSLVLMGEAMKLHSVRIDGRELKKNQYKVDDKHLTINDVPDSFTLETEVIIKPQHNTELSGLYKSANNFCTQCESHGFRRISYFLDRPDVLTRFTTTISADKDKYPILLSNGNLVEERQLDKNRRWVKWQDPSLKPCYLFALVAGDFDVIEDNFTTMSEREVKLFVYVEKGKKDQAEYAMSCLKKAMRWDEEAFGREYELEMYMIVAVSDFNVGAMENKGLNIFNDKYILAKPTTATDIDYLRIESVIGHEYFHNWSGNRVTVRDWFQITLKEGLTIFRDQNFSAEMNAKTVRRIEDINVIRNVQFLQDSGPLAHPIYPDHYIEINNFYTVTVYNKGAEVIRMMATILGPKLFRKAMDLYFTRNDAKAVTVEEFVQAMEDASGIDLMQFRRWYHQAGTPTLDITDEYDAEKNSYTLTVKQSCSPTPGQPHKENFHIPLAVGALDKEGNELVLQQKGDKAKKTTHILPVKHTQEVFRFVKVAEKPLPSLLRNFSAPVKVNYQYSDADLLLLMQHDSDEFNRWEASQRYAVNIMKRLAEDHQQGKKLVICAEFVHVLGDLLEDESLDKAYIAELLTLPSETYMHQQMAMVDVDAIHAVREFCKVQVADQLSEQLLKHYSQYQSDEPYSLAATAIQQRCLKNLCLAHLMCLPDNQAGRELCVKQYDQADNLTDMIGALQALNQRDCPERETLLERFYETYQQEPLVVNKWFSLHAAYLQPGALDTVQKLLHHPAFDLKNPNKVYALINTFCSLNTTNFHLISGAGYRFLVDQVLAIDKFNRQVAARIIEPLTRWQSYDKKRQALMKSEWERVLAEKKLSKNVYEMASKSLAVS